jgi:FkbM family methyltransferase
VTTSSAVPHRRPFLEKLNTSLRKRWFGRKPDGSREARCRYFGVQLNVDLGDEVGYEIAINRFEWRELKLMIEACERLKPDVFVDVGANLGLYTCVMASTGLVPRVIAFEPDKENFARLSSNLALNGLTTRVESHEVAVGARPGTATLIPSSRSNRGMSRIAATISANSYDVALIALNDVVPLKDRKIAIKIDVEGFESEVLTGAEQLLGSNGGYAQIEAHGDEAADRLTARMAGFGWRFRDRYGLDVRFEKP